MKTNKFRKFSALMLGVLILSLTFVATDVFAQMFIAHGGANQRSRSHSQDSIERALSIGLHEIELNVVQLIDGELIIAENPIFTYEMRFGLKQKFDLRKLSLEDLKTLRADGYLPEFLTLSEALGLLTGRVFGPQNVDGVQGKQIKDFKLHLLINNQVSAEKLVNVIQGSKLHDMIVVHSADWDLLEVIKNIDSFIKRGLVIEKWTKWSFWENFLETEAALYNDILPYSVSPHTSAVNSDMIAAWQKMQVKIYPFGVETSGEAEELFDRGVDGIITNKPTVMIDEIMGSKKVGQCNRLLGAHPH